MELLNWSFFADIAYLLANGLVLTIISCLGFSRFSRDPKFIGSFALTIFAFATLGFVTGEIMSDSREPAVSAVLPAVLTLMGGVVAFLIGTKGAQSQIVVSALVLNFGVALFVGADYGAAIRDEVDVDSRHAFEREDSNLAVEEQRLADYVSLLKLKHDYQEKYKSTYNLDLSKFTSSYEQTIDKGGKEP
jgi:hypothetical protein